MAQQAKKDIVIVGRRQAVLPFGAIGMNTVDVADGPEAITAIKSIKSSGSAAVVFVTEDVIEGIEDQIQALGQDALPAVIAIPSFSSQGESRGVAQLKAVVQKAVGSDILADD